MYNRREVLKSTAIGTTIGLGVLASSTTTTAAGASFGDGVNLQPAYYCGGDQNLGWDLMNDHPDIETVRIEIEPPSGGETSADLADIRRWIDEANANGYQVIATYHHWPNNGSGDPQDLQDAADWWVQNYDYLSQNSSFVINLHNEWGTHDVSAQEYGNAYDSALSRLRDSAYDGTVICDVPGYGQEPQIAADSVDYISDDDIAFSVHVYAKAWNQYAGEPLQMSHLDYLDTNQPHPCLIGEFGPLGPDDRTDWSAVVDHAKSLGWPVLGWAWNGDGESDPMNMTAPFWGDDCGATSYSKTSYFSTRVRQAGRRKLRRRRWRDDGSLPERRVLLAQQRLDVNEPIGVLGRRVRHWLRQLGRLRHNGLRRGGERATDCQDPIRRATRRQRV